MLYCIVISALTNKGAHNDHKLKNAIIFKLCSIDRLTGVKADRPHPSHYLSEKHLCGLVNWNILQA